LCFTLILGEALTRVVFKITRRDIARYRRIQPTGHDFQSHPYISYILTANRKYYDSFGNTVCSINSLGFRGEEVSIEKTAGTFRIICVGGSTTFGAQGDKYNWPYVLQQLLREHFLHKEIEVINAGVPAYSSAENLTNLEFRLLGLKPDLVIINQGINDAGIRVFPEEFGFQNDYSHYRIPLSMKKPNIFHRILKKVSYLYAYSVSFFEKKKSDLGLYIIRHEPKNDIYNNPWNVLKKSRQPADTSGAFRRNTVIIAQLLKSFNIGALLVTAPHYSDRLNKKWDACIKQHNDIIREVSAEYEVSLKDLDKKMSGNVDYFINDGVHMTGYGAKTKANHIFSEVIKNGFVK
jgi:lysophospholipase L1-like esterase